MLIKNEKGAIGADIMLSIVAIITYVAIVGNLIVNNNINIKKIERKTIACTYAVKEIENIKNTGYINSYNDLGVNAKATISEADIVENSEITGYHKKVEIEDYVLLKADNTKESNILKKITVTITYLVGKAPQELKLATYVINN